MTRFPRQWVNRIDWDSHRRDFDDIVLVVVHMLQWIARAEGQGLPGCRGFHAGDGDHGGHQCATAPGELPQVWPAARQGCGGDGGTAGSGAYQQPAPASLLARSAVPMLTGLLVGEIRRLASHEGCQGEARAMKIIIKNSDEYCDLELRHHFRVCDVNFDVYFVEFQCYFMPPSRSACLTYLFPTPCLADSEGEGQQGIESQSSQAQAASAGPPFRVADGSRQRSSHLPHLRRAITGHSLHPRRPTARILPFLCGAPHTVSNSNRTSNLFMRSKY